MNKQDEPRDLLDELETLQRVLDDAASDQVDQKKAVPVIEPSDDIPVLDDLFDDNGAVEPPILKPEAPILKAVPAAANPTPHFTAPAPTVRVSSGNPFLPQSILDRLAQEREAAQFSAEEAHRTMQKIMSSRPNDAEDYDNEHNVTKLQASTSHNQNSNPGNHSDAADFADALSALALSDDNNSDQPGDGENDILDQVLDGLSGGSSVDISGVEALLDQVAQAPDSQKAQQPTAITANMHAPVTELQKAEIIDDLIDEIMPALEAKLRARLKGLL